tara:strand:- start:1728 stop:2069 length:342 start_codon:yes stop_codon:yes gene_type:complete
MPHVKSVHVYKSTGGTTEQHPDGFHHVGSLSPIQITDMLLRLSNEGWDMHDYGDSWSAYEPMDETMIYQFEIEACWHCGGKGSVAVYNEFEPPDSIVCPVCGGEGNGPGQVVQ